MRRLSLYASLLLLASAAAASEVDARLAQAIRDGDLAAARAALDAGAVLERPVKDGITPLILTAYYDQAAIASLLVARGARTDARADDGYSTLDIAIERGRHDVVHTLLEHWLRSAAREAGATWVEAAHAGDGSWPPRGDLSVASEVGALALCRASARGDLAEVRSLLAAGAPVDLANRSGYAPLALAVRFGQAEIVELLLAHGADVNAHSATKYGSTPLMEATRDGRTALAVRLLAAGARVNERDVYGDHALNWAAYFGGVDLVRALLTNGADPAVIGQTPDTALAIAVRQEHRDVADLLRAAGAPATSPAKPTP